MAAPSRREEAPRRVILGEPLGSAEDVIVRPATLPCNMLAASENTPTFNLSALTVVIEDVTSLRLIEP